MIAARNAVAAAISACLNNVMNRILRASKCACGFGCESFTHRLTERLVASDECFMGESRLVCNSDTCVHGFVGSMRLLAGCSAVS
jgi:hypothetical protein